MGQSMPTKKACSHQEFSHTGGPGMYVLQSVWSKTEQVVGKGEKVEEA